MNAEEEGVENCHFNCLFLGCVTSTSEKAEKKGPTENALWY